MSEHTGDLISRLKQQLQGRGQGGLPAVWPCDILWYPGLLGVGRPLFGQVTNTQTGQEERRIFITPKLIF